MAACHDGLEIKMNTLKFQRMATGLAATVIAAAFTSFAMAPAQARTHRHDAAAPAKLSLDHRRAAA